MKIMSKSQVRGLIYLQGILKLTTKIVIVVSSYYLSKYSSILVISRFQWLI